MRGEFRGNLNDGAFVGHIALGISVPRHNGYAIADAEVFDV
jgi:hypothetical protein